MKWSAKERMLALTAKSHPAAHAAIVDAGFDRTYAAVMQYRIANGLLTRRKKQRRREKPTRHNPGAGRTRAQNRALWKLAESKPNPREYARERAAILRGETP